MLTLTQTFNAILNDKTDLSSPQEIASIVLAGSKGVKYNLDVPLTDTTLSLGGITTIGYMRVRNRAQVISVTTPGIPTVIPQGAAGAATWTYKVVALQSDGTYSSASAAGSTATGNATLTGSNFNRITWAAVDGATSYDIYRTVSGGTPASLGKIGNTTALTFDDTGLTGDTTTAPAVAADNLLLLGHTSGTYPLCARGGEFGSFHWNGASHAAIHVKSNTRIVPVEFTILDL